MKKIVVIMATTLIAGIASADLAVLLKNTGGIVTQAGSGGGAGVADVLVQLVWSPTDTAEAGIGASLGTGEHLLTSMLVSGTWGTWNSPSEDLYNDLLVGGNDGEDTVILEGYIFVRIFDNAATEENDYYLQQYVQAPSLAQYNSLLPDTIYDTNGALGGMDINAQGNQVIPEPTVAALLGIFGSSMLVGRRLFSKKS